MPLMVPTLNPVELTYLLSNSPGQPGFMEHMPKSVMDKAIQHARMRMSQGLSPFKD